MRILVISDTHRYLGNLYEVMEREKDLDAVIHCGDICCIPEDVESITGLPLYVVAGNCDYDGTLRDEIMPVFQGRKFFVSHGHVYGVNAGTNLIKSIAIDHGATVVCFGHTHVPLCKEEDGILIVNPGSLSSPRQSNRKPSYAVLTLLDNGEVTCQHYYL
ncbi:MAG: metallophosphoesterase [Lachnospiraceae bacterium]|nr:metallophosphoesterase [Lachnospiraceae bacterium]